MANEYLLAVVAIGATAYAVLSDRSARSPVTGTMVFMLLGLAVGPQALDLVDLGGLLGRSDFVSLILTATLVIVLFTDASAINSTSWRDDIVPARLLGVGLPLAMLFGWAAALVLLPGLDVWEAAVLAAMLAPTDAALGKAVVSNPRVPARIRQALNIESGLNDGITLPFFIVFLETAQAVGSSLDVADLALELVRQVGIAIAVGIVIGALGARAVEWGRSRRYASQPWAQISLITLAVAAYAITTPLGGSGFIAAWVAGLLFGRSLRRHASAATTDDADEADERRDGELPEFAETTGEFLTMVSFFVLGVYLGPVLDGLTWSTVGYAVVSLAVVRLAAVTVALTRSGMQRATVLYAGWFGPRGLATLILTIEIVETSGLVDTARIFDTALFTVALSVIAHGATAWWGSNRYADVVDAHPAGPELGERVVPTAGVRLPVRVRSPQAGPTVSRG